MFDNIEELEREIKEFRDNILASNELLTTMRSLVAAMKQQTKDVQLASSDVVTKLDAQVSQLQSYSNTTLDGMISKLDTCIADLRVLANQTSSTISTENKVLIGDAVTEFKRVQAEYIARLDSISDMLSTISAEYKSTTTDFTVKCDSVVLSLQESAKASTEELIAGNEKVARQIEQTAKSFVEATNVAVTRIEQKEAELVKKIDAINYEELLKTCMDMKKSVETKLTILMAGVGVAVVLAVLALIIR